MMEGSGGKEEGALLNQIWELVEYEDDSDAESEEEDGAEVDGPVGEETGSSNEVKPSVVVPKPVNFNLRLVSAKAKDAQVQSEMPLASSGHVRQKSITRVEMPPPLPTKMSRSLPAPCTRVGLDLELSTGSETREKQAVPMEPVLGESAKVYHNSMRQQIENKYRGGAESISLSLRERLAERKRARLRLATATGDVASHGPEPDVGDQGGPSAPKECALVESGSSGYRETTEPSVDSEKKNEQLAPREVIDSVSETSVSEECKESTVTVSSLPQERETKIERKSIVREEESKIAENPASSRFRDKPPSYFDLFPDGLPDSGDSRARKLAYPTNDSVHRQTPEERKVARRTMPLTKKEAIERGELRPLHELMDVQADDRRERIDDPDGEKDIGKQLRRNQSERDLRKSIFDGKYFGEAVSKPENLESLKIVRALVNYSPKKGGSRTQLAHSRHELEFRLGDLILVLEQHPMEPWWVGLTHTRIGYVMPHHVDVLQPPYPFGLKPKMLWKQFEEQQAIRAEKKAKKKERMARIRRSLPLQSPSSAELLRKRIMASGEPTSGSGNGAHHPVSSSDLRFDGLADSYQ